MPKRSNKAENQTENQIETVSQDAREAIALMAYTLGRNPAFQATYEAHMDTFGGLVGMLERSAEWALHLETQAKARGYEWGIHLEWPDAIDELVWRFVHSPLTRSATAAGAAIDAVRAHDQRQGS